MGGKQEKEKEEILENSKKEEIKMECELTVISGISWRNFANMEQFFRRNIQ